MAKITPAFIKTGADGEDLALHFLQRRGFRVVEQNFRGRNGEIDIIALDCNTICFIEVKTRRTLQFGSGSEAVGGRKQQKIMKTALLYLKVKGWSEKNFRFDVISIFWNDAQPQIEYLENAFEGF